MNRSVNRRRPADVRAGLALAGALVVCLLCVESRCINLSGRNPNLSLVSPDIDRTNVKSWFRATLPTWSQRSGDIFFFGERDGWTGLARVAVGGTPKEILGGQFRSFDISPDEALAVLITASDSLLLLDLQHDTCRLLATDRHPLHWVRFAHSGDRVFYTAGQSLFSRSLPDGQEDPVMTGLTAPYGTFDISSGDSLILCDTACYNIRSSPPRIVSRGTFLSRGFARAHPVKPAIAAFIEWDRLHIVDVVAAQTLDTLDPKPYNNSTSYPNIPDWSPDGSKIVFSWPVRDFNDMAHELWILSDVPDE